MAKVSLLMNYNTLQRVQATPQFRDIERDFSIHQSKRGSFVLVQVDKRSPGRSSKTETDVKELLLSWCEDVKNENLNHRDVTVFNKVLVKKEVIQSLPPSQIQCKLKEHGKEFYQIMTEGCREKENLVSQIDKFVVSRERFDVITISKGKHANPLKHYDVDQETTSTLATDQYGKSLATRVDVDVSHADRERQSTDIYNTTLETSHLRTIPHQRYVDIQSIDNKFTQSSSNHSTNGSIQSNTGHNQDLYAQHYPEVYKPYDVHEKLKHEMYENGGTTYNETDKQNILQDESNTVKKFDQEDITIYRERYPNVYKPYPVKMDVSVQFQIKNNLKIDYEEKSNFRYQPYEYIIKVERYDTREHVDWNHVHIELEKMRLLHDNKHNQDYHSGGMSHQSTVVSEINARIACCEYPQSYSSDLDHLYTKM